MYSSARYWRVVLLARLGKCDERQGSVGDAAMLILRRSYQDKREFSLVQEREEHEEERAAEGTCAEN